MRVFITGGSGFIGQGVVKELLKEGHQVLALARSDKNATFLENLGASVHRGSLDDVESLKAGAAASDGVIHLAFSMDFSDFANSCATDKAAIEAMGAVLAAKRSNSPLVIATGTLLLQQGHLATEDDEHLTTGMAALRGASETAALSFNDKGVLASSVRLPPTNHGDGDRGFVPLLISTARKNGFSGYIGDGQNRWPTTHRDDSARVFVLALKRPRDGVSRLHPVAEEGVRLKDIAEAIGEKLNVPAVSKTKEEAEALWGFVGSFAMPADNPVSSKKTREQLGWDPVKPTLIEDIKLGSYFDEVMDIKF